MDGMGKISIKLTIPHRKDGWKMISQVEVKQSLQLKALSVLLVMTQSHSICYLEYRRSATTTRSSYFLMKFAQISVSLQRGRHPWSDLICWLKDVWMLIVFCWTPPLPCTHPEMTKLLPVITNSVQLELKEHTKACFKKKRKPNPSAMQRNPITTDFPTEQDTVQDPAHLVSY